MEEVAERESSIHERIMSPIASRAEAEAPTVKQRRSVVPFGRQFSMARMAARIRRPRRRSVARS